MEPLLDSATGAPRRLLEDLHPSAPEDTEGPEVGDASMLSSHTSAATESTAHESSVASSYRFPAHEGMFSGDYTPFSLQGLQRKHNEEMATAGKDQSCDVKRNDSHALINALRSLQDKVKALELERVAAAERYKNLKEETDRQLQAASSPPRKTAVKTASQSRVVGDHGSVEEEEEEEVPATQSVDSGRLKAQLANQERELLHMRQLLQKAEGDKIQLLAHNKDLKRSLQQTEEEPQRATVERSTTQGPLRTEHLHLASGPRMRPLRHEAETGQMGARSSPSYSEPAVLHTQSGLSGEPAVNMQANYEEMQEKLRGLEKLIQEEHREREKMKNTLLQVQSIAASTAGRLQPRVAPDRPAVRQTAVVHKRKKSVKAAPPKAQFGRAVPGIHYRLDLKDVPFVVGKSTSQSHSVAANYQKVVSLMKVHSHTLCGAIAASAIQREDRRQKRGEGSSFVVPSGSMEDMKSMLSDLEGEFASLAREHQLAVRQLQQCVTDGMDVGDTQDHLKKITDRMESKAEHIRIVKRQISTLQKHRQKQERGSKKVKGTKPIIDLDSSSNRRDILKDMAYYEDRDLHSTSSGEEPTVAKRNLSMLRNMRNLQVTLQKDDMWWE